MSSKHRIISVTGSSGAGTSTGKHTFEQIFRREGVSYATLEGDAFHAYDREGMKQAMAAAEASGNNHLSHFGPEANLLGELEEIFALSDKILVLYEGRIVKELVTEETDEKEVGLYMTGGKQRSHAHADT